MPSGNASPPTFEESLYLRVRHWRGALVYPFVVFFSALGVSANLMSYFGLALVLVSVYVMHSNLSLALTLFVIALFADNLDGEIARYRGTASDHGKFTDVVIDNVTFSVFMLGMAYAGFVSALLAGSVIYTMLLCKVLMVVKKNVHKESDWLIKPYAGFFPNFFVYVLYTTFIVFALGFGNFVPLVATLSAAALAVKSILDFRLIQRTVFVK